MYVVPISSMYTARQPAVLRHDLKLLNISNRNSFPSDVAYINLLAAISFVAIKSSSYSEAKLIFSVTQFMFTFEA